MRRANDLGLVLSEDLSEWPRGARFLTTLRRAAPEFAPDLYGEYEPLTKKFAQSTVEHAWSPTFLWKAQARAVEGGVFNGTLGGHAEIGISDERRNLDDAAARSVLRALSQEFQPMFGYLHRLNPQDFDPRGPGTVVDLGGGNLFLTVGAKHLRNGIPDLYWATILGPPFSIRLGKERIASTPIFAVEELAPDVFYLQLTASLGDSETDYDQFVAIRQEAKAHLDGRLFFRANGATADADQQ